MVTGAASGIGRAIAERLIDEGAMVVGGDLNEPAMESLAQHGAGAFVAAHCDVTDEDSMAALIHAALDRFGPLTAMFNVAGGSRLGAINELDRSDWSFTIDLCLNSVFYGTKHAAQAMIDQGQGGAIVNIASLNSRVPMIFSAAYATAKAGVAMLGQSAALEFGTHQIRVNTVSPGLTDTPLVGPMVSDATVHQLFMDRIPLGRPASPADIASAATYLASDDAAYITGVNLFVDGGWEQTAYPDMRAVMAHLLGSAEVAQGPDLTASE